MLNREFLHLQSGQGEKGNSMSVSPCLSSRNPSLKVDYFKLYIAVLEKEQTYMAGVQPVFIQA